VIGIEPRTVLAGEAVGGEDKRQGRRRSPERPAEERAGIVATANGVEYRDMRPKQIVPRLADKGVYIGGELLSVLHEAGQMVHRGRAKAPERGSAVIPPWHGPNQV
jgi:hypothetical protein